MSFTNNTKNLFLALLLCVGLNSLRGQSNESSLARNSLSNHMLLPADERTSAPSPSTILMIAGKQYCVTTREVTAKEYCDFLNATAVDDIHQLYDERMGSDPTMACIIRLGSPGDYYYSVIRGAEDFKITYVDPWSGARFCNWITNGQQASDQDPATTEHGIYDFGQTIDDLPTVSLLQNKNSNYFLSGDIEASGIYETPLSFYHSDPFLRSNISALSIDILTLWSGVSQELVLSPRLNTYIQSEESFGRDATEILSLAFIAALFAGVAILSFGAAATKISTHFGGRPYPVAAFVGTALAARSASDKVMTKLTTKNGVQPFKYELLAFFASIAIGLLVGQMMTYGGFISKPLVFEGRANHIVASEETAARVTYQHNRNAPFDHGDRSEVGSSMMMARLPVRIENKGNQYQCLSGQENGGRFSSMGISTGDTVFDDNEGGELDSESQPFYSIENNSIENNRIENNPPTIGRINPTTGSVPNVRYVFGLFREATPEELTRFAPNTLTMMMLGASLFGSAWGAHMSTHLDPYIAKLIGNTGG